MKHREIENRTSERERVGRQRLDSQTSRESLDLRQKASAANAKLMRLFRTIRSEGREPTAREAETMIALDKNIELDLSRAYELEAALPDLADLAGDGQGEVIGRDQVGREIRALRREDRLAQRYGASYRRASSNYVASASDPDPVEDSYGASDLSETIGAAFRRHLGIAGGPEHRAMSGVSQTGGGFLVDAAPGAALIDLARDEAVLLRAGVRTIPMQTPDLTIAKLTGEPTASFLPQNVPVTFGDFAIGGVKLVARTLHIATKVSRELFEDAANLGAEIQRWFAEGMGVEMDRQGLTGAGAAEIPLGIENWPNVGTQTGVGALADYDGFSTAVETVATNNGRANAVILNPREAGTLDRLKDSTLQPLMPPESWKLLQKLTTNSVPKNRGAGSNESLSFVGDFTQMVMGVRTAVTFQVSDQAGDSSGSAFTQRQVWVGAFMRADFAVLRPKHFIVLSGITA